jgi:predicted deacylase
MPELSTLHVNCKDGSVDLPLFRFGEGGPRAVIVAGVHGREHSGVRVAYALAERLAALTLRGTVEILPVANPQGFTAESRENPVDGKNLGESFFQAAVGNAADGNSPTQTEAIASRILEWSAGCSHLLDLHAAGEARYLPHALFIREEDGDAAAAAGLPFTLLRRRTREGSTTGVLCQAAVEQGTETLALELGGGTTTFDEDVQLGVDAVLSLLSVWGYVPEEHRLVPTHPERVYLRDERKFIRAWEEGAFYPDLKLGVSLEKGTRIGTWVSLESFRALPVLALERGFPIYVRTRCRSHSGDTLVMLLPIPSEQRTGGFEEESRWHR